MVVQGRVRGTQYVVTLLEPCAEGTHETIAMEFDLASLPPPPKCDTFALWSVCASAEEVWCVWWQGGRIPRWAIDRFLADQAKLFDRLGRFVASENGQSSIQYWGERLPQERAHEGHPMHGVSLDG